VALAVIDPATEDFLMYAVADAKFQAAQAQKKTGLFYYSFSGALRSVASELNTFFANDWHLNAGLLESQVSTDKAFCGVTMFKVL